MIACRYNEYNVLTTLFTNLSIREPNNVLIDVVKEELMHNDVPFPVIT
jgi:hypothetical protein